MYRTYHTYLLILLDLPRFLFANLRVCTHLSRGNTCLIRGAIPRSPAAPATSRSWRRHRRRPPKPPKGRWRPRRRRGRHRRSFRRRKKKKIHSSFLVIVVVIAAARGGRRAWRAGRGELFADSCHMLFFWLFFLPRVKTYLLKIDN